MSLETVCGDDGFQKFRLFGIAGDGQLQNPEKFQQLCSELAGPAFGVYVIERRGFLTCALLHTVLEPRLHDLQARNLEVEDLGRDGGELALADAQCPRRVVVVERLGVAVGVVGDGLLAFRVAA